MTPGETEDNWYMSVNGKECWSAVWTDPYTIDLDTLIVSVQDKHGERPVAGPFDTLDAAKAAYLLLMEVAPHG